MGDGTCDTAPFAGLGEYIRVAQPEDIAVASASMLGRSDARVDGRIARCGSGRQDGPNFPHACIATVNPALKIAEQATPVAVGDAVEDD